MTKKKMNLLKGSRVSLNGELIAHVNSNKIEYTVTKPFKFKKQVIATERTEIVEFNIIKEGDTK